MFPIGDDKLHGAGATPVTWTLIVLNVFAFIYEITLPEEALEQFFMTWGAVPAKILAGENLLSLFSSIFMHGGWMHLIGNMLFLWVFGDNIETVLGHLGFLAFYLLGGLAATAAHIFFYPTSLIPSVGASGAIAACLGSYIVMFPHARIRVLVPIIFFITIVRVPALFFLFIWAVTQFFYGVADLGATTAQTAGVAYWAHIGGFVFGVIVGFLFRHRSKNFIPLSDEEHYLRRRIGRW